MEHKRMLAQRVSSQPTGEFEAVVYSCQGATFEEIMARIEELEPDLDGDLIPASAFTNGAEVILSCFNHDAITGETPPAGRGTLHVEGLEIVVRGRFDLTTDAGRRAYELARGLGDLGEWSIGYSCESAEYLQ